MKLVINPSNTEMINLSRRPIMDRSKLDSIIKDIFRRVQRDGDTALLELTKEIDGVSVPKTYINAEQLDEIARKTPSQVKAALDTAYRNIELFHRKTTTKVGAKIETMPGVMCWVEERPIEKVGLYVPGGTAPLISTLLMLGIPAKIANCKEIIVTTPPSSDGLVEPAIAYTARKLGLSKLYLVGGAQAIAAMACGTKTIPKVAKIFGPGNQYVTQAKRFAQQFGVAADMPAGPSEIMVVADESAVPSFVAADLLSQAEHGTDSQVMLVVDRADLAQRVIVEIEDQIKQLPRRNIARKALAQSSCVVLETKESQVRFVNAYAPEHLVLSVRNPESFASQVNNAGSVFLGNYTPESAGDYASGTNHTLPTDGWAKSYSGLSVADFQRKMSVQSISRQGLQNLATAIVPIAEAEGLSAHAIAVKIRTERNKDVKKN